MPKYLVECTADALITELWEVEADNAVEAAEQLYKGNARFLEQSDVCGEDNREIINVEEA